VIGNRHNSALFSEVPVLGRPDWDEKYSPLAIMIWTTAATQNLFYVGKPLVNHETWPPTNKEPCMKAGGGRRIVDRHLERR